MRWTATRILWACLLATQPVGIILLLVYFMPAWEKNDKEKEDHNGVSGMEEG